MLLRRFFHLLLTLALAVSTTATPFATASTFSGEGQAGRVTASVAPDISASLAAIEKTVDAKRKELGIPGMSLVIVKDDHVIYMKGFGLKDVERNLPVTPDTLFAIGSCTKAFTAMAAMMSVDEGKLSLDDSPKKYLPYFKLGDPEADAKITIRDMLSHRSGLNRTDLLWGPGVLSREEVIRAVAFAKPTAKLGEKFQYQNVMFSAAGEAVAKAQKSTWERVISERIFKPLGMKMSDTAIEEMQKAPDFSLGYEYIIATKQARRLPMRDLKGIAPAGAINSNAKEMAEWVRLMLGGGVYEGKRLVSEKSFRELVSKQMNITGNIDYSLGWALLDWNGHRVVEHGGGIDGFNSLVAFMPDEKLGVVMLTNVSGSPLGKTVMESVWTNLVGKPQPPAGSTAQTATASDSSADTITADSYNGPLKELLGSYEREKAGTIDITVKDGQVVLIVPGQPAYPLVLKEKDILYSPSLPDSYRVTLRRDASGKVSGIMIKQPEGEFEFKRTEAFVAPVTTDELMTKMIEAAGGEANLRKHKSMIQTLDIDLENQGITGSGTMSARAPDALATELTFIALGKRLGTYRDFFDGTSGGEETSFSSGETKTGKQLDDARVISDFYQLLNWKTLFKTITIKKMSKLGDEDVYVVLKTPEKGNPITEYVSTKSFQVLKRDLLISSNTSDDAEAVTEIYSDYRTVDGVVIPFKTVSQSADTGDTVLRVKDVKFNVEIPDSTFRAQTKDGK